MSYFEQYGERLNPGNIGRITSYEPISIKNRFFTVIKGLTSLALVLGSWGYTSHLLADSVSGWLFFAFTFMVYLVGAFCLNPRPDYSNMGMGSLFIDHPCRVSDDINRGLLMLKIFLFPGRILSTYLLGLWIALFCPKIMARKVVLEPSSSNSDY